MSHSRKHVKNAMDDYPEPKENESIVKVIGRNGGNVLEVEYPNQKRILVFIPSKFKGIIWIKKGNYVIIQANEENTNKGKILGCIEHILVDKQIEHLKEKGLWPNEFKDEEKEEKKKTNYNEYNNLPDSDSENEDDLEENTNRLVYQEEGSSTSSDSDD